MQSNRDVFFQIVFILAYIAQAIMKIINSITVKIFASEENLVKRTYLKR